MSDQRPEWMPDPYECKEAWRHDDADISGFPGIEALAHRTGLRAQIAALQEMNKCLTYKHLGNAITDKLIALRKELENG